MSFGESAPAVEVHAHGENHCAECDKHSRAFARERVEQGHLVSNHWGSDLGRLLSNCDAAGQVTSEFSAMLGAQVQAAPIYQQRCEGGHGPAANLVRRALVREGADLRLRDGDRPRGIFLAGHGGLSPDERTALLRHRGEHADVVGPE